MWLIPLYSCRSRHSSLQRIQQPTNDLPFAYAQNYLHVFILSSLLFSKGACGGVVVKALHYYSDGRGIDSRWCHWIFQWHNPSDRTMALGSTQPLVKISTRNIPGGNGGRYVRVTTSPPLSARMLWKSGSLNLLEPSRPHRACYGTPYYRRNLTFQCLLHYTVRISNSPHVAGLGALQIVIGIQIAINLKRPPRSGQWLVFKQNYIR
jgi:hypothetical protein